MGHPSKNIEESAKVGLNYKVPAQVSEEKIISKCPRDHSCDVLAKNVAAFCPFPKNLLEAKLKSFRLMALTERILRQPSTNSVIHFNHSNADL